MQGLLLKSPLLECFCGQGPPPPNSELLLSLHIWELLVGRTQGYCTPPHIMREAWQGKACLVVHHHTGVCACVRVCVYVRESRSRQEVKRPVKYHLLIPLWFIYFLYTLYCAQECCYCFDQWPLCLKVFLSLSLSPGRTFSRWARDGLRLLPPTILAGRAYCGSRGDRYPAYVCVLCLPVLPPRLCLTVSGLLLCSQVSRQHLDQSRHS